MVTFAGTRIFGNAKDLVPYTAKPSLKQKVPLGHWNELFAQRAFMDDFAKKFNITSPEGWYSITGTSVKYHGGYGLLQKYNSLRHLLESVYPEYLLHLT